MPKNIMEYKKSNNIKENQGISGNTEAYQAISIISRKTREYQGIQKNIKKTDRHIKEYQIISRNNVPISTQSKISKLTAKSPLVFNTRWN